METITHSQVQELIMRLPVKKLPIAYRLLVDLSASNTDPPSLQQDFMLLPVAERRRLMAEQAKQMMAHYEQTASERRAWQAGDFVVSYLVERETRQAQERFSETFQTMLASEAVLRRDWDRPEEDIAWADL